MNNNFKDKLTQFVNHISFLWHWRNFFFLFKYPFYKVYNRWTEKFCGYSFTEYDSIPEGWRKAFGKQLSEDIKAAGKQTRKRLNKHLSWKKILMWEQIKEKYGELRLYAAASEEIRKVLQKYELLSNFYCINCGKKAKYQTQDWIENYCEECFEKELHREEKYLERSLTMDEIEAAKKECKITEEHLPKITRYENGKAVEVDLKKEYNIDVKELLQD